MAKYSEPARVPACPTQGTVCCMEFRIILNASTTFLCFLRGSLRSLKTCFSLIRTYWYAYYTSSRSYEYVQVERSHNFSLDFLFSSLVREPSDPSLVVLSLSRCQRPFRFSTRTRTLSSSFVWLESEVSVLNPKLFVRSVTQLRVRRSYACLDTGFFL